MKKILSVLMALALLVLPVLSMAEAAEELEAVYETYTHTDDQYTIMYPSNWTLLNKENIQSMLEAIDSLGDEELSQMIAVYGSQMEQTDMVMMLNETGMTNINIVCQYVGMRATDEVLLSLAPTLVSQLGSAFEGIEFVNEGSLVELNGVNALMVEYAYELSGTAMQGAQVYVPGAENLYIFTFTCSDVSELEITAEDFNFMLGSLEIK